MNILYKILPWILPLSILVLLYFRIFGSSKKVSNKGYIIFLGVAVLLLFSLIGLRSYTIENKGKEATQELAGDIDAIIIHTLIKPEEFNNIINANEDIRAELFYSKNFQIVDKQTPSEINKPIVFNYEYNIKALLDNGKKNLNILYNGDEKIECYSDKQERIEYILGFKSSFMSFFNYLNQLEGNKFLDRETYPALNALPYDTVYQYKNCAFVKVGFQRDDHMYHVLIFNLASLVGNQKAKTEFENELEKSTIQFEKELKRAKPEFERKVKEANEKMQKKSDNSLDDAWN